jgi:hypothetical protein
MEFSSFIEQKYLEWQTREGRGPVADFADWLGSKQPTVSMWMSGENTPRDEGVIYRLALRLGLEVYDILELPRPDLNRYVIDFVWDKLDPELQVSLRKQAEQGANNEQETEIRAGKRKTS